MYQKLVIVGRLGRDPELRYTPQGKPVASFSVAVDTYRGPGEQQTDWFRVSAWGNSAEACNQYLHKGDLVLVEGTVRLSTYTKRDGMAGASMEVNAAAVKFLQTKSDREGGDVAGVDSLDDEAIPF